MGTPEWRLELADFRKEPNKPERQLGESSERGGEARSSSRRRRRRTAFQMAVPETNDPSCYPLTGMGWSSNPSTCPKEYQLINTTADGSSANFAKGFGQKSSCFLCVSSLLNKENPQGDIVSDIQLLPDKNPLPSGYAFIAEFLDPSEYF
ncbi:hypothetical protein scyTo_0012662 [Scyliorhinus torazame]|uniref:MABP domain-containing protein n=1 Tax=Scyliorhinus torazame TaxID=75743 RepID=A0A401NGI4_SCYTO|nr:hypothetical protein [Scyliorhinus torazame]